MALTDRIEQVRKFGHKHDKPDFRDLMLDRSLLRNTPPPANYDPTGFWIPGPNLWMPAYDQGEEGACASFSSCALVEFNLMQTKYPWCFTPSMAFQYYNLRLVDGDDVTQDTGGTLRGAIKALINYGVCPNNGNPAWSMPYVAGNFAQKPSDACYKDAILHCALEYQVVPQDEMTARSLNSQDIPIVFGFDVYSSFMTQAVAQSGAMPTPGFFETLEGGHAVCRIGYLTNYNAGDQGITDWAIIRNSWGTSWGCHGGTFLMPQKVWNDRNTCTDFWSATKFGFSHNTPAS